MTDKFLAAMKVRYCILFRASSTQFIYLQPTCVRDTTVGHTLLSYNGFKQESHRPDTSLFYSEC